MCVMCEKRARKPTHHVYTVCNKDGESTHTYTKHKIAQGNANDDETARKDIYV